MTDEMNRLEREVEAMMRSLSADFPVEVPAALVLRVKAAVRHEVNEEWLAGQPAPLPSGEAMQRVHGAVRGELARWMTAARRSTWGRTASALAAAAMIALCVGVIRQAGNLRNAARSGVPEIDAAQAHLERFMTAAEEVFATDSLTASIHDDLSVIEEDIDGWRTAAGETGGLGEIVREIDSKLAESPKGKGVSRISVIPKGVLG